MTGLFLQEWGRPLVVAHAVFAFAAAASAVHVAVLAWSARGRQSFPKRGRTFAWAMLVSLGLCLLTGLLAYPNFRINVRALYFDHHAVWAANGFDIKENLGTLAAPLALLVFGLVGALRRGRDAEADTALRLYSTALAVVLVGCALLGLTVALVKGV